MAKQQGVSTPSGFGGLVRFNEEFESRFKLTPWQVVGFLILIVLFVFALNVFFPVGG
jgi:preprotein translocase subunit Sec61beta